ncbi:MAG: PAS domain S-box protein [Pseudomonadota bacterium]
MDSQATATLTVSESRLLSVLDTAVNGIIVIDDHGRILVFNKACEQLFGYRAAEMIGKNVSSLMPPKYADHHDGYLTNYLTTGERKIIGIGRAVEGRHADGTVFPLELSVGETTTPVGRQFIGILRDLRPQLESEERLNQLQAQLVHMARVNAMDEMGAALAHELNQPLTAVMLYLQAVMRAARKSPEENAIPQEMVDILERALKEADRAGKIIQRMRQFVEKREPERQAISLARLVDEAVDFTMTGLRIRDVAVHRSHDDEVPEVSVDPVQIQQIIVNLVRNALQAVTGSAMRQITIETVVTGNRVSVSVEDSGPGIKDEALPDLFKAFSSSKKGGMGLGLAISKSIAQSHGGDLVVDPGGKGRGARFSLYLPIDAETGATRPT